MVKIAPLASSSEARELLVAYFICTNQTDPLNPTRFDSYASKPPLFHIVLCLLSGVLKHDITPAFGRTLSMISVFVGSVLAADVLKIERKLALIIASISYPILDEGFSAKVDAFNFLIIWFALWLVRFNVFFTPFIGFFLFLGKGFYSIAVFLFLYFFLVNKTRLNLIFVLFSSILPGVIYSFLDSGISISKWFIEESFKRFVGSEDINFSPWYYYVLKIMNYFPVNLGILGGILYYSKLKNEGRRVVNIFIASLLLLSISYGKRANYLLPFWPLVFVIVKHFWEIIWEKKDLIKLITLISTYISFFIIAIFGILLVLCKGHISFGLHKLDVLITVFNKNDNILWLFISWFILTFYIYKNSVSRLIAKVPFILLFVTVSQTILAYNTRIELFQTEFPIECNKVACLKHPRNESLDVLLYNNRHKLVNSIKYDHDCILYDHNQIEFNREGALLKNSLFAIFKK